MIRGAALGSLGLRLRRAATERFLYCAAADGSQFMKCFVGIDLGSTTTKAMVLDEDSLAVGRGITNSRSNYETACNVARSEAFADVRLELCARALPMASAPAVARNVSSVRRRCPDVVMSIAS